MLCFAKPAKITFKTLVLKFYYIYLFTCYLCRVARGDGIEVIRLGGRSPHPLSRFTGPFYLYHCVWLCVCENACVFMLHDAGEGQRIAFRSEFSPSRWSFSLVLPYWIYQARWFSWASGWFSCLHLPSHCRGLRLQMCVTWCHHRWLVHLGSRNSTQILRHRSNRFSLLSHLIG